ncbi:MAG: 5-(carboxyamino)imidazole ribonucleotide synthase [Acidimicrobiia bacterium]
MPPSPAHPLVAVLGGGQLGRMLGIAGVPLGVTFRFLDPSPEAGAGAVGELVIGELGDPAAVARTAVDADVVTFEWEGVPAGVLTPIVDDGTAVWPPPDALDVSQDRLPEKQRFAALGIETAALVPVHDRAELDSAVITIGLPAVLKTRCGGYDGKGQAVLRNADDVARAWGDLGPAAPLILEAFVPFDRELSILAVRNVDGDTRTWPLVENTHVDGILRTSLAPAPALTGKLDVAAQRAATALLDDLDYVGVLAIELFQVGDRLLANEMAPRVHNSGHWTIEGAVTSQFENHVRAVLGWPLGSTEPRGVSAMVNCIGVLPDPEAVLAVPGAHLHRYGKTPRRGRKVGHVTVVSRDETELEARLDELRGVLPADNG